MHTKLALGSFLKKVFVLPQSCPALVWICWLGQRNRPIFFQDGFCITFANPMLSIPIDEPVPSLVKEGLWLCEISLTLWRYGMATACRMVSCSLSAGRLTLFKRRLLLLPLLISRDCHYQKMIKCFVFSLHVDPMIQLLYVESESIIEQNIQLPSGNF